MYVDMNELRAEGDRMIGDEIAEDGIKFLQTINFTGDKAKTLLAAE